MGIGHREHSWLGHKTHFLISIDALYCNDVILALHGCWGLQSMGGFAIYGVDCVWRALTVLLSDEKSVFKNWRAAGSGWLVPAEHHGFRRESPDLNVGWLWDADRAHGIFVHDAISLYAWLIEVEGGGIRYCNTIWVDSVTAFEAEAYPVLLADIGLVEWEVHFVNWTIVVRSVYLHLC